MSTQNETWRPELLAGYVDGELSARERLAVESYLAAHPEAREEMTSQKEFARSSPLWQKVTAKQPSEVAWDRIALNIHAALQPQTEPAPNYRSIEDEPRMPIWRRITAGGAVVAALLLLSFGIALNKPSIVSPVTTGDSFAVATSEDVNIISVQGDDSMLVVGQLPVSGPIEFVTVGDVVELAIDNSPTDIKVIDPKLVDPKDPKKGIWIIPGGDNKTMPTP